MLTDKTIQYLWKTKFQATNERARFQAREELIKHYRYLVRATSTRISPGYYMQDDLISVGMIGLIKAIDQFDLSRCVKFETYAISLIRGAILEMLREDDWVPRSVREISRRIDKAVLKANAEYGRSVTDTELAGVMNVDIDQYNTEISKVSNAYVQSVEDVVSGSSDTPERLRILDVLSDNSDGVYTEVAAKHRDQELGRAIEKLRDLKYRNSEIPNLRQYNIIMNYYYNNMTFKQIGKALGISESRVYQLHGQAVVNLKNTLGHTEPLFVE